jgi:flavin reductase (DIM6/NTAB) family NADH-FMN oxidoreductase RutF
MVSMKVKFRKFAKETLSKLADPGLLLVGAKKDGKPNVMAIGWGFIGVLWGKPVFVVAVRPSRFTYEFIEDTGEFTVNVPNAGMEEVISHCGEVSGRKRDKFRECKLTVVKAKKVKAPVIKQCKVHYECRVLHKLKVKRDLIPANVKKSFYPRGDYQTLYFGQILTVY